jgi:signal transduction histidine kinase
MEANTLDNPRVMRNAAWMWTLYVVCLFVIDLTIYAGRPQPVSLNYHLINAIPALIFLGLSYALRHTRHTQITTLALILLISGVPILAPNLFDLKLPPAPLSNLEGMVLRQLPVLMIGLVLVGWHYNMQLMLLYSVIVNLSELALVLALNRLDGERLSAFIFIMIIRLVCFIVVGLFVGQLIVLLRRQQTALQAANQQLRHYAGTLETLTVSRERNRMSRELHDTVVHTLSGLSVQLETTRAYVDVDPVTVKRLLDQSLAAARSGLQETRGALKALRASPLEDLGLIIALRELATMASERGRITLDVALPDQNLVLSPEVEHCLYRIAQEAVENVVHHAHARHLALKLSREARRIELLIQDDGVGFDPSGAQPAGHYGMRGMRERAELVGGDLSITSRPNAGVMIRLVIEDHAS